jgi:hypothetical protein
MMIAVLAALLPLVASIKCYTTNPDLTSAPIKYEMDIPNGGLCVRYKFTCTVQSLATDTGCKGTTAGTVRTIYTMLANATYTQMLAAPAIYQEAYGCSTDYCNYTPVGSGSVILGPSSFALAILGVVSFILA